MSQAHQRNGLIDLLRLIFTISVLISHFGSYFDLTRTQIPYFRTGLNVEFFFTLSGFLMAASADHLACKGKLSAEDIAASTLSFMKRKIAAIAPVWYLVLIGYITREAGKRHLSLFGILKLLQEMFPSFLMLQSLGLKEHLSIPYAWYISVMLVAQLVLFPILAYRRRLYTYITAPLVILFYCAFALQYRSTIVTLQQQWYAFFYPSLPRAIALLSGGAICYELAQLLRLHYGGRLTNTGRCAFAAAEILIMLVTLHEVVTRIGGKEDIYQYVLVLLMITLLMSDLGSLARFFTHPVFGWFGKISLSIYLSQGLALGFFEKRVTPDGTSDLFFYLPLAIGLGIVVWAMSALLAAFVRSLRARFRGSLIVHA